LKELALAKGWLFPSSTTIYVLLTNIFLKMLFRIFVLLFTTALSSCEEDVVCCPPMDNTDINLMVVDSQGQNLLDPKLPTAFRENTIKIFYEENGKLVE
jgi:hypothetical protein